MEAAEADLEDTVVGLGSFDTSSVTPASSGRAAVELLRLAERVEAEAVRRMVPFDVAEVSIVAGYATPVRHLAVEAGMSDAAAARVHRVVRHCARYPITAKALFAGQLTMPYVEVLAAGAAGLVEQYFEFEHELIGAASGRDVGTFRRLVQNWRHRNNSNDVDDTEQAFEQRSLTVQRAFDGSGTGRFRLDPVAMEIVEQALATPPDRLDGICPPRTLAQRRADALADMADCYLNPQPVPLTGTEPGLGPTGAVCGTRTAVDVIIDLQTLEANQPADVATIRSELASGTPIARPVLEQLLCDATYRRHLTDGPSHTLEHGHTTPGIPTPLRRVIQIRDRHCQFDGCDRSWQWCDVHHLIPRSAGGPTNEPNLILLCRFHHTLTHQAGWTLTRDPTTRQIHTTSP